MQHITNRITATAPRIKREMSWLGVPRHRVPPVCIVEVQTEHPDLAGQE